MIFKIERGLFRLNSAFLHLHFFIFAPKDGPFLGLQHVIG